ncbi:MAG: RNA polymerase sigma factor [Gemmatimonadales bacterium]
MSAPDVHRAIDAVWRIESAGVIASLARMVRDVDLAEDLAQDALVAALESWPRSGIPDRPGAWLLATARRRGIDRIRHRQMSERRLAELGLETDERRETVAQAIETALDDPVGDELLGLMFATCHPVLSPEARSALTLRLLGGLTTAEIARAFLAPEPTIAQRIVRAKRTLREARVPVEAPRGAALSERLGAVLEVLSLIFNEGYSATAGSEWFRADLCHEALRLGRILAELAPAEPEVHGLVALMEIQASRIRARTDPAGRPILLADQDRSRWDHIQIQRGLAALARAEATGAPFGPYALQGAIAACHARARSFEATDWTRIVALYDALLMVHPTPVVALNRAVALGMMHGPAAGLEALGEIPETEAMSRYHLLAAVRGDFLFKLGRHAEAGAEFVRAAELAGNERERALLLERAAACGLGQPPEGR